MILVENLSLRFSALSPRALPTYTKLFNQPEVTRHLDDNLPKIPEEIHRWLLETALDYQNCRYFLVSIGGKTVGHVGLKIKKGGVAEVGIVLDKEWWGKGVGKSCLRLIEQEAKRRGFYRLTARIRPANERSRRLFQSMGFEKVGEEDGFERWERSLTAEED